MKSSMDFKFWEYLFYFFVTTFLLLVGFFLLLLGVLHAIPGLAKRAARSSGGFFLSGLLVLCVVAGYLYYSFVRAVDLGDREVVILIRTGDDFAAFASKLQDAEIITSRMLLEYTARWSNIDKHLIPGEYHFSGKNSCRSVLEKLHRAKGTLAKVTIYEGAPIWKVAAILDRQMGIDSADVIALNRDRLFLDSLGLPCLEGYLFPETYLLAPGMKARAVIRELVGMFHQKTDSLWNLLESVGLSSQQVLVMASIVQAEAKLDSEMAVIASVYYNRLKFGMTLDADPTVIYGLGGLDRLLTRDDLENESPYNTYRIGGLPPTPINSPGLPAILAAIRPDSTRFLYFVADSQGKHRFSFTNDEHNRTRRQIRIDAKRN